ncbi:Eco47II family restriction endonuclease [Campylobacter iguaniorum]|uniref:Eco47II family restriction endonuclease n=1 Tax=Campylobacter iguaniorum TaxID=1244531 RepID=UPI0007C8C2BC|nr:Eco47II family restriction endonuclease [Campylobacter iguaniorum]
MILTEPNIFNKSFKEIIDLKIHRQRDKSNNNTIGYFHQNIFKYFKNCEVPDEGWDIVFQSPN